LTLGRTYSIGSEPESENPLPQAYVEARHTLQVSPYNLSKRLRSYCWEKNVMLVSVGSNMLNNVPRNSVPSYS
jgi:hypothetical protein